jgi:hypothetical protein
MESVSPNHYGIVDLNTGNDIIYENPVGESSVV